MPLQIVRQDITKMKVDAIVNTTNEKMMGYSGVDFAVHAAAGPALDEACARLAPLACGTAKITEGYNLNAKYIIHTSGPIWQGGLAGESILLKSCYLEALKLAVEYNCSSVAFPLISSGAYGYPKDKVLKFAIAVITEFLYAHELMVYLCVFDRQSYEFSKSRYSEIRAFIDDDDIRQAEACRVLPLRQCVASSAELAESPGKRNPCLSEKRSALEGTSDAAHSLRDYVQKMDKSFAYKLFDWIDARGMTDVECYKRANVDKKTFSKMKCNPDTYRPSKQTAVAFAIALRLNLDETQALLSAAGLTLSQSFVFDKIIRYFIQEEIYDIFEINEALFEFDQVLLGC